MELCPLQTLRSLSPSLTLGWVIAPSKPSGWALFHSDPQGKATPTYLWPTSQCHNLASHSNHQLLEITGRILLKHNTKVLVLRLWVADFGQNVGAGAMQVIDTPIKGNVVEAAVGHAAATACRVAGLDTVLYSALLVGPAGRALLASDLATRPTLTAPLTLRAGVEGLAQWVVEALVEASALAHGNTGVAAEHKAGITDAALTAALHAALGRREAWAADRAGVTAELVVAVGRALEGCGDQEGMSQAGAREGTGEVLSGRTCPGESDWGVGPYVSCISGPNPPEYRWLVDV